MTIVRIGATQKYANGWEKAFGKAGKKSSGAAAAVKSRKTAKPARKKAKRKAAR